MPSINVIAIIYVRNALNTDNVLISKSLNLPSIPSYYVHFNPEGYAYYIINPWRLRHDEVIRRILEAGLIEQWKRRAWIRMKEEHQNELRIKGEEGIKFDIKPLISEMTMNDFQVNFSYSTFLKIIK